MSWTRAGRRRRQRDHRLHGHAVRRRDRADAGRRSAPRSTRDARHRADQRHRATRSRSRRRTAPAPGPPRRASNAVTPQASIFEFATPAVVDAGDGSSVVLGVKFRADVAGSVTGMRFYKAAANTGTHVGTLWTRDRHAACARRRSPTRSASGWQTVTFATPGGDHRRHDLRRQLPRAQRATTRSPARRSPTGPRRQPAAARARPTRSARTASTPTAATLGRSRPAAATRPTTGWTSCSPRRLSVTRARLLHLLAVVAAGGRAARRRAAATTSARPRRAARRTRSSARRPGDRDVEGAARVQRGGTADERPRARPRSAGLPGARRRSSRASRAAASRPCNLVSRGAGARDRRRAGRSSRSRRRRARPASTARGDGERFVTLAVQALDFRSSSGRCDDAPARSTSSSRTRVLRARRAADALRRRSRAAAC